MSRIYPDIDPDGLLEYSVVFTDRSLNHMSQAFQGVMRDISSTLRTVYRSEAVVVIPGGGSFAMEAVARQFAQDQHCLVIRNGWFSYRWSQIFEMGRLPSSETVLKAGPVSGAVDAPWRPAALDSVLEAIARDKPGVVFAPHVETASGMILPDDYLRAVADAVHAAGGLFVLDCVASGCVWVDMADIGVDVLISAPQKGWSSSPCAGLVMLSARGLERLDATTSNSFAADLKRWHLIMQAYEQGGHAYHATMPTDGLARFARMMHETLDFGLDAARDAQWALGTSVRELMKEHGFASVADEGFQAPGVVVSHTSDDGLHKGARFAAEGLQTAAGVPLMCDEPDSFKTFRVGLFGLDKLASVTRTRDNLATALAEISKAQ